MTEVIVLGLVSLALFAVVMYAYWYSMRETYAMRRRRFEDTDEPEEKP